MLSNPDDARVLDELRRALEAERLETARLRRENDLLTVALDRATRLIERYQVIKVRQ